MKLLVDGHNLIGQMPDLSLSDPDDEEQLVSRLQRYATRTGHKVTAVFDRGTWGGASPSLSRAGVEVIFAPAGQSADRVIINRIRRIQDRTAWRVVSSDRAIQAEASWAGVAIQRSEELATELDLAPLADSEPGEQPPSQAEVEAWLAEFSRTGRGGKP
jgi:hypothetical protein